MNEPIIKVENLNKVFKLYSRPKDRLKEALSPFRKKYHHDYHALKGLTFEVKKGESVAILGRNGAGKSTLLKVLTGVISPTSGNVSVKGRIAALLELGSGFNPMLSGLENVYFQGAIMGFSKEEMELRLPGIINFADIGEFIHQPVRTYSSGMFSRLAFSIAINVDPDILIVDEALSVGDGSFRQKCFRKIKEFINSDKIVLFVSHDLQSMRGICNKAIVLDEGEIYRCGDFSSCSEIYLNKFVLNLKTQDSFDKPQSLYCENFEHIEVVPSTTLVTPKQWMMVGVNFVPKISIQELGIGIFLTNSKSEEVFGINNYMYGISFDGVGAGVSNDIKLRFLFPGLAPGEYSLGFSICDGSFKANKQLVRNNNIVRIVVLPEEPSFQGGFYVYNSINEVEITKC